MSFDGYPRNLSYFVKRLGNFSKNTFKLQTLNQSTASAGSIITVDLPNNSIVDLSTLMWYFEGSTTHTTSPYAFPRNIETIIERLELEINGQLVSGGCSFYNHLFEIIADTTFGDDMTNRRKIMQNGDRPLGTVVQATNVPFTIVNWLGPLGSIQPHFLDTNLLGNVRLRITLSSPSVLVGNPTSANPGYTLNNMFFSVDCLSIDDGNFYASHQKYLEAGGLYEMPFNNYYSFSSTSTVGTGATKFSLSTKSLNKVWTTWVNGTTAAPNSNNTAIANAHYFERSGSNVQYQFNINNQYYPNYRATAPQAYTLTQNAYNMSQDILGGIYPGCSNLTLWNNYYWVACQSFSHDTDGDERFVSGIDTRGNTAQGFVEFSGHTDTTNHPINLVFAQTSPVLKVMAGQQIDVEA